VPPTVAESIARTLVGGGVETAFGVIGSGNFLLANALRDAGAAFYAARHENGAMTMTDGYGRASGRLAICTTHQGPGFTNALTGLTEASKAGTPAILLAAETPAGTLWSNFQIDQDGIAERCGAASEHVRSAATAVEDAARALRRARVERRPVVLGVPVDLPGLDAGPAAARPLPDPALPAPDPDAVAEAAALIAGAERVLLLAGRGAAVSPGAREAIERLGERCGALLATSAMAHGLFAGLPFALGIAGGFASPLGLELAAQADVVVSFGAGLNRWTSRHGHLLAPDARVIQVDLDPLAPGRLHPCEIALVGDAARTAKAVEAELDRLDAGRSGWRGPELAATIAARHWRDEPFDDRTPDGLIDPRALSIALDDLLPAERTVVTDSGHFLGYPAMYLAVPDAQGFVFPNAFQSVGLGLGCAIGAAIARPERLCVAALGDGGAFMALPELETAARYRLRLLVVVYDDAAYGAEVHHFGPQGHAVDLTQFPDADIAALGRAAGGDGVVVRRGEDLAAVERWLAAGEGPLVVDAKVDPTVVAEWLEEAFRAH
jgi:thiamine pyrophosphate-dependent acetolactate synthase large subunit-like protein